MPTAAYADGSMQFGAQSVSIGGQIYVLRHIKVKRTRRRIIQNDQFGAPFQKVHIRGLMEGSAQAQLTTSTQVAPAQDQVFTLSLIGGTGTQNFITEDVEDMYEMEGETFCDITFSQKLV
jgi:hypothetical protein